MQKQTDIRVFIADDHLVTIQQLSEFINAAPGMTVVGTASDGAEVWQFFANGNNGVDLAIIDIGMPEMNGLRATGLIKKACKQTLKVIVMTGLDGNFFPAEAIRNHADGFIAKSRRKAEFIDAIKRVHNGEVVILPELDDDMPELREAPDALPGNRLEFSPLEIRVLRHTVKDGLISKQIALEMRLGVPYVEKIRLNLMTKLGAKNAAQLGAKAQERGLLD